MDVDEGDFFEERRKERRARRRYAWRYDRWRLLYYFNRLRMEAGHRDDWLLRPGNFKFFARTMMHTTHCGCGQYHQYEKRQRVKRMRREAREVVCECLRA